MHPEKLFTLIIPTYNEGIELIEECLMSVMTQQFFNFDYLDTIIVVDGSKGQYTKLLESNLESRYSKLKLRIIFNEENGGAGVARNIGIDNAEGEYVVFADCDDVYCNNLAFAAMYRSVVSNNEFPDYLWTKFIEEGAQYDDQYNILGTQLVMHTDPIVWSFAKVIKRSVLNKYNIRFASDIRIYEDTHFCAMAYALCDTFKFIDNDTYFWRWRKDSTIRANAGIKRFLWTRDLIITNLYLINFLEGILDTKVEELSKEQIAHINEVLKVKSKLIVDAYTAEQECSLHQPNLLKKVVSIVDEFKTQISDNAEGLEVDIQARLYNIPNLPQYKESFATWAQRRGFVKE